LQQEQKGKLVERAADLAGLEALDISEEAVEVGTTVDPSVA